MNNSIGFEYLAWEPCITKHKAHYDDPWIEDQDDIDHPNKKLVCVQFDNGDINNYTSIAAAARDMGFNGKAVNMNNVATFCRRIGAMLICVK
jgi:hypothetical protein